MAKNVFTRIGRPPKMSAPAKTKLPSGERQGASPTQMLDTAIPARAFPRGQSMPKYHDDPAFCGGGNVKRR